MIVQGYHRLGLGMNCLKHCNYNFNQKCSTNCVCPIVCTIWSLMPFRWYMTFSYTIVWSAIEDIFIKLSSLPETRITLNFCWESVRYNKLNDFDLILLWNREFVVPGVFQLVVEEGLGFAIVLQSFNLLAIWPTLLRWKQLWFFMVCWGTLYYFFVASCEFLTRSSSLAAWMALSNVNGILAFEVFQKSESIQEYFDGLLQDTCSLISVWSCSNL